MGSIAVTSPLAGTEHSMPPVAMKVFVGFAIRNREQRDCLPGVLLHENAQTIRGPSAIPR